jgi:DNA repair exonuclease SbcCD ATPase subunit
MPDDDVQDEDAATDESTSSEESTSDDAEDSTDDAQGDAETEDGEGDGADDDSDGDESDDDAESDPEFEEIVKGYQAGGKRSRKEALQLLARSHKESTKRVSEAQAELDNLKKAAPAKGADEEVDPVFAADPDLALPIDKHPRVVAVQSKLTTLAKEYIDRKAEIETEKSNVEKLKTELSELNGEMKRAEDHERSSLESKAERLRAQLERVEGKVERLKDQNKDTESKYVSMRDERLPEVKAQVTAAKENAKRAGADRAKAVAAFGRQWDAAANDVFTRHGIPADKEIREWLDTTLNAIAQAEISATGQIDDLDNFMSRNIDRAVRQMNKYAGAVVKRKSGPKAAAERRLTAGPKGDAARATAGKQPKSESTKTWSDYQAEARKAGL